MTEITAQALVPFATLRRWVVWREELRNGKKTKVPYSVTGRSARVNDPTTWSTRDQAQARAYLWLNGEPGGIGFILGDRGDGMSFGGVDLDTCLLQGDVVESWAQEIVDEIESYTEVSPSGTGVKIFFQYHTNDAERLRQGLGGAQHGREFKRCTGQNHPPAIELHLSNRYFTVTGNLYDGCPDQVKLVGTDKLLWLLNDAGPKFAGVGKKARFDTHQNAGVRRCTLASPRGGAAAPLDQSRSAEAFRIARRMRKAGDTFEEMVEALRQNPFTASWVGEKGELSDRRELKRLWERNATARDQLPRIEVRGGAIGDIVDGVETAVLGAHFLYQRGDHIVRVAPEQIKASDLDRPSTMRIVPVSQHNLIEELTARVNFVRYVERRGFKEIDCPKEIAQSYLERVGKWKLPILTGLCSAPTLRGNGSILDQPGYDGETGVLYTPFQAFPPVPQRPTRKQALASLKVLSRLIDTFPFCAEDGQDATGKPSPSRSVELSAILSASVFGTVKAPLHGFDAPNAGSGKSKLVEIPSVVATGRIPPVIAQGADEEETEKRLAAELIAGSALITLDNCSRPIDCDLLNQVLTQPFVKPRILGQSKNIGIPTTVFCCATGNNLVLAGDLTRRAIVARLDPRVERPELRQFKHDPVEIALRDRERYVVAALTVMRARVVFGPKIPVCPLLGSFRDWSYLVRDALVWLGEPDPCETMERTRSNDPVLQQLGVLLQTWHAAIGSKFVTAADVARTAESLHTNNLGSNARTYPDFFAAMLAVAAGKGDTIDINRLGKFLARHKDRMIGNLRLAQSSTVTGGLRKWAVV